METKKNTACPIFRGIPFVLTYVGSCHAFKEIRWFWRFPNQPCLIAEGYKINVPIKIINHFIDKFGIFWYHDPMFGLLDKPINSNSTVGAFQQNPLAIFGMSSTRKEGMHPMHPSVSVQPPSASPFAKAHQRIQWFLVSLDHVSDGMVHCFSNAAKNKLKMCAC